MNGLTDQMPGFLVIGVGNVQIIGNLIFRQLTQGAGLEIGVVGLDQGLDAAIFQKLPFFLQGFPGKCGENQPMDS